MATRGVNKVILVGNLGSDPEVRFSANGQGIANINIATSDTWQDKATGETREKTEWHRVVLFGKLAEIAGQYLKKGSQVYIEGQLQTRKWQDQNNVERYTTEVVVNQFGGVMQMLGGRNAMPQNDSGYQADNYQSGGMQQNNTGWGNSAQNNARPAMQNNANSSESSVATSHEPSVDISDEEIPF